MPAGGNPTSGNGRYQFWSSATDAWESRPVAGRGAGTWEFWWRRHATIDAPTRDSHSLLFDVVAELGTLGVLALLALLGSALWFCAAAARAARGDARAAVVAVGAAALAWAIGAATDWMWEMPALTVVFFALAALGASARGAQVAGAPEAEAEGARRPTPLVGALALGAWIALVLQAVGLTGAWALQRSEKEMAHFPPDLRAAEDAADLARKVQPWAASPHSQLALVRVRSSTLQATPEAYRRPIADAREAVDREPTNWRTWLVLTRIEARAGRLDLATRDNAQVARLAKASPIVPTYQQLEDLAAGRDLSLNAGTP